MKQLLLIISLLVGLNASQATAEDWSGEDKVLEKFKGSNLSLFENCKKEPVLNLVRNILIGIPHEISARIYYHEAEAEFVKEVMRPFYMFDTIYEYTIKLKSGYPSEILQDVREANERDNLGFTEFEMIQASVLHLGCFVQIR